MTQSIGSRVKMLRESLSFSQENLAKQLGVDRTSLSQVEHDKRPLKDEELIQLSKIFNVTTDQLLGIAPLPDIRLEKTEDILSQRAATPRINVPAKNVKKFKEVLLYILSKVGAKANVGETVLYKLLYFIDFDYYEKYETQIIGATYIKNHHGPTPCEFIKIVNEMIAKKELEVVLSQHFQFNRKKYLPHRDPDLSLFNANEIKLIDDVLSKLSNMNAAQISEYSHKDVPWIVTPEGKSIDYETVFYRVAPYSAREYNDEDLR
jgi:transcriptional regulator with XRE-family HTH domain